MYLRFNIFDRNLKDNVMGWSDWIDIAAMFLMKRCKFLDNVRDLVRLNNKYFDVLSSCE